MCVVRIYIQPAKIDSALKYFYGRKIRVTKKKINKSVMIRNRYYVIVLIYFAEHSFKSTQNQNITESRKVACFFTPGNVINHHKINPRVSEYNMMGETTHNTKNDIYHKFFNISNNEI